MFSFSSLFGIVEADVRKVVIQIQADVPTVAQDIDNALKWCAAQVPAITQGVEELAALVQEFSLAIALANPAVAAEINVAVPVLNTSLGVINAFAASMNASGGGSVKNDASALLAAYNAVKSTQAATASMVAAISTPPAS